LNSNLIDGGYNALTWEEVLRLVLGVVQHYVVACRVDQPVVLKQVDVLPDFTIDAEYESV
jgi:hypothetical protein